MQSIHAFAEKVALVVGGTSPIGRAVSLQLALLGAFVIVADEDSDAGDDRLAGIATLVSSVGCPSMNAKGISPALNHVDSAFGRIDLFVNCLKSDAEWQFRNNEDDCFAVRSAVEASRLMSDRPRPLIVNVMAATGESDLDRDRRESDILTEAVSDRVPSNFRVNSILCAGRMETRQNGLLTEVVGLQPDDVARIAVFLLSSESKAINRRTVIAG